MKILVDMNLAPSWCDVFASQGWESAHWSTVGEANASDSTIMTWAAERGYIVFTHDLDFGALLAATQTISPSVVQVRGADVLPEAMGPTVVDALKAHRESLTGGALMVIDPSRARLRLLPLRLRP